MFLTMIGLSIIVTFLNITFCLASAPQVIYAINCGSDSPHTDSYGIKYEKDPLTDQTGIASDYGKRLLIGRVPPNDYILYQTERYHTSSFGYDIPIKSDGDYVLVLKFCEVYFNSPEQKVFDVVLNGDHIVVADLDIFDKVGRGVAYDEYVPFKIVKGRLTVNGEVSDVSSGQIRVELIKGHKDNPKINALYVLKGTINDVPKLPPLAEEEMPPQSIGSEQQDKEDFEEVSVPKIKPRTATVDAADPYSTEEATVMLPVFIAIGAFIPVLFCLCKL